MWTEKDGNTNGKQFGMIAASIVVTLVISFVAGVLNGKFSLAFYWSTNVIMKSTYC